MNKIKLLVLEGCHKCEKLKQELNRNNIRYEYEVCKSDTEICDSIEDLTGCSNYPIVLKIVNGNFIEEIAYITREYEDVGKTIDLNNSIKGKPLYSIDQLIDYVIKL
jgi:glutaredoxin